MTKTFVEWLHKIKIDRMVGRWFESEMLFSAIFHRMDIVHGRLVYKVGYSVGVKFPKMLRTCDLCGADGAACRCYYQYHAGTLSQEILNRLIFKAEESNARIHLLNIVNELGYGVKLNKPNFNI